MTNRPRQRRSKNRRSFLKTTGIATLALAGVGTAEAKSPGQEGEFQKKMSKLTNRHGRITNVIPEEVGKNRYRVMYIFEKGRQPVFFSKQDQNSIKVTVDSETFLFEISPSDRKHLHQNLNQLETQSQRSVAENGGN